MKKIIFLMFFCMSLVSCVNPFDKYVDSIGQVTEAMTEATAIQEEITVITTLLDGSVSNADISTIFDSLTTIQANLSDPIIQAVVTNLAESLGIDLDASLTTDIKPELDAALADYVPTGDQPSKAAVEALLTSLIADIQAL